MKEVVFYYVHSTFAVLGMLIAFLEHDDLTVQIITMLSGLALFLIGIVPIMFRQLREMKEEEDEILRRINNDRRKIQLYRRGF